MFAAFFYETSRRRPKKSGSGFFWVGVWEAALGGINIFFFFASESLNTLLLSRNSVPIPNRILDGIKKLYKFILNHSLRKN